jgi:hypothetical protein
LNNPKSLSCLIAQSNCSFFKNNGKIHIKVIKISYKSVTISDISYIHNVV